MDTFSRSEFSKLLKNNASFLRVKANSKTPAGSFAYGRHNRISRIPDTGNYGIIPNGRLIVLDVDTHKGYSIDEQIKVFSKVLDIDLYDTFAVRTPSSGIHFYFFLPDDAVNYGEALPKTSLRKYSKYFQEYSDKSNFRVDADIRTGSVNAYVVGPGSFVDGYYYEDLNSNVIQEIPVTGVNNILSIVRHYNQDNSVSFKRKNHDSGDLALDKSDSVTRSKVSRKNQELDEELKEISFTAGSKIFSGSLIKHFENALKERDYDRYHVKRAFIVKATQCCFDVEDIFEMCKILRINYDTFRNKEISDRDLLKDIKGFIDSSDETFHGSHCPSMLLKKKTFKNEKMKSYGSDDLDTEKLKERNNYLVRNRMIARSNAMTRSINPGVVDVDKVFEELIDGKDYNGKYPKQIIDSMKIVVGLIQPMTNVGSSNIVISSKFLQNAFNLSASRASQALRVLREKKIVFVTNKQRTGLAATYMISPSFINNNLTKILRNTWGSKTLVNRAGSAYKPNLFYDYESNTFRFSLDPETTAFNFMKNYSRDKNVLEVITADGWSSLRVVSHVMKSYLKEEGFWRSQMEYELVEGTNDFFDSVQETREKIAERFSNFEIKRDEILNLTVSLFDFGTPIDAIEDIKEKDFSISKACSSSYV